MTRAFAATQPVEQFFQFSLLGLLASGYLAVLGSGYLDLPTAVFAGLGLLARALLVAGVVRWNFSPAWANAATVAYMGFYPLDYLYLSREFIPATVHLIFFLAVVRILTAHTNRDYLFVKVIAFLELLAATLLSSNMNFFVFLTLFVVFGVATFCCSEIRRSAQAGRRIAGSTVRLRGKLAALTAAITAGIILMTAGLFFMLPRTARAAFRTIVPQRYHLPGFSNEITLGQIGAIKQQSTPVMHVRIDSPFERSALKWRGAALTQFDGVRWYNPPAPSEAIRVREGYTWLANSAEIKRPGNRVTYEVRIGAVNSNALFFAGSPESLWISQPSIYRGTGDSFRSGYGSSDGLRYSASSLLQDGPISILSPPLTGDPYNEHLLLPAVDRRVIQLARRVAGSGAPSVEQARAIEKHLRTQYAYTTELLDNPVPDAMAHFLFERKKGHCEYFASAMAVMLRAIHIPSRVVTGFQSGVFNPLTGWHIIRTSDAHSWVEAYLPGRGWTTFDPTPADPNANANNLWAKWALYVDAADMFWQQWVMNYDLNHQLVLASRVEESSRALNNDWLQGFSRRLQSFTKDGWKTAEPYAFAGVVLVAIIVIAVFCGPGAWKALLARRHARRLSRGNVGASDASLLYARMLDILRRRGYEKPAWLTPAEFARILPPSPMAVAVQDITNIYHELRYAQRSDSGIRMVELLKELENSRL
jgi:transglutaminase-like putative cysteine protease